MPNSVNDPKDRDSGAPVTVANMIHEHLTQISGQAILTGNFDLFESCFHLPHDITTSAGTHRVESREEFRAIFNKLGKGIRDRGITRYDRVSTSAKFVSDTEISATHDSFAYGADGELIDQTTAYAKIEFINRRWGVSAAEYTVSMIHIISELTSGAKGNAKPNEEER